jgi:tRNA modification GTPase
MSRKDTICAQASGAGRAAIAVIRISGPATGEILRALCGLPAARHASLRTIRDPRTETLLDRGLVLWFPAPASFTGEDMAELHVHGGRAVVANVLDAALSIDDVRLAEPGEFAARAFENGKIDLTEVEGLADLINAETDAQARQALAQAGGSLRRLYESWRGKLLRAQALAEAGLDFADEADVAANVTTNVGAIVAELILQISNHLADRRGERLRDGFRVVIVGAPNAGKSSLLNALARRDVAIVSEEAGTTRDIIEVHLDLDGLPVILTDTAGLREASGKVEVEGIRRALARVEAANLVVWLIDAKKPVSAPPEPLARGRVPFLAVRNKIDLAPVGAAEGISLSAKTGEGEGISLSAKTGEGIDRLVAELKARAREALVAGAESPAVTRARHRAELEGALAALERSRTAGPPELKAEELRIAARHLGRLTGNIDVEEVLGAIFSEFCIGK